jgi:FKBP-type peptidyl-prolyl cis-trans isomerase FkpA
MPVIARLPLAVCLAIFAAGCSGESPDDPRLAQSNLTELVVEELSSGTGEGAMAGRSVRVHYTGWLYHPTNADHKGTEFDSSHRRNEPFEFTLGTGQVIPGWEQGIVGMKVGGRRRLIIPPDMAYGPSGAGDVIPPNATLVFDVELLEVGQP